MRNRKLILAVGSLVGAIVVGGLTYLGVDEATQAMVTDVLKELLNVVLVAAEENA